MSSLWISVFKHFKGGGGKLLLSLLLIKFGWFREIPESVTRVFDVRVTVGELLSAGLASIVSVILMLVMLTLR